MSEINDLNATTNAQPVAFCQQCGKPLTPDTLRKVGPAAYCEPCLELRLHGAPAPPPAYTPVNNATPPQDPTGKWNAAAWTTASLNQSGPNPGLAALLGLIPGVGAMYNEQYAKGFIHLIIFAVLCILSDSVNGVFTLFIFAWIAYMSIEAHHTARARRDGTPLPNPFGFNDLAQRLGFDKGWPTPPNVSQVIQDAVNFGAQTTPPPYAPVTPPPPSASVPEPEPTEPLHAYTRAYTTPPTQTPYANIPYAPIPPVMPPTMPPFDPALYPPPAPRFPVGAVVLIALGTIFLLTTAGVFRGFPPEALIGTVLIGFAAWAFLRKMTEYGASISNDFTPAYSYRLFCAVKSAIWLALIGSLLLLDGFDILRWSHSWPLFLIVPGVLAILDRVVTQSAAASAYPPVPPPAPQPEAPTEQT